MPRAFEERGVHGRHAAGRAVPGHEALGKADDGRPLGDIPGDGIDGPRNGVVGTGGKSEVGERDADGGHPRV